MGEACESLEFALQFAVEDYVRALQQEAEEADAQFAVWVTLRLATSVTLPPRRRLQLRQSEDRLLTERLAFSSVLRERKWEVARQYRSICRWTRIAPGHTPDRSPARLQAGLEQILDKRVEDSHPRRLENLLRCALLADASSA